MSKPRVLFCTAAGGGYGFGHLKRCLSIVEQGSGLFEGEILLLRGAGGAGAVTPTAHPELLFPQHRIVIRWEDAASFDLIVSDQRDTTVKELLSLTRKAPVIALDDLGAGGAHAHCTVYSLPTIEEVHGNFKGLQYLVLDQAFKDAARVDDAGAPGEVIVSFGGSDPHDLTGLVVMALRRLGIRPLVVRGPFFSHDVPTTDCEIIESPRSMAEVLSRAGLVITSFGMTLFEALSLGTPVVLLNHSPYHEALARTLPRLESLGYYGKLSEGALQARLEHALSDRGRLKKISDEFSGLLDFRGAERIVSIIEKSLGGGRSHCLFDHGTYRALRREESFTLMSCSTCRDLFLFEFERLEDIYENGDYFLSEYERQYGRTYAQDRDNIRRIGATRLEIIEACLRRRGPAGSGCGIGRRILDVGCALGFFLEIARERGWKGVGVEVSGYGAAWAREHLNIEVVRGSFLSVSFEPESFDAFTLFFVAEHFKDVEKVIERAHTLLRRGGVLACALPNRGGVSYRTNRRSYVEAHPRDHYFDTAPRNMVRFLKSRGFRKKRIRITGIHPERFFRRFGLVQGSPLLRWLFGGCARLMRLGDTFEYYGVKR
jgi:spore coat polysaccharide biosynthesis predicted glycosyltransferase SpsG/SAM-dependent methyltransferase